MGEMTAEERDELRAALEAAGCHRLASRVQYFDDPMVAEFRSLLRREVVVVEGINDHENAACNTVLVFSSLQAMNRWDESNERDFDQWEFDTYTIDAEVPDVSN